MKQNMEHISIYQYLQFINVCVCVCVCVCVYVFPADSDSDNLPTVQETQVGSLDQEYPLEKGMATHSIYKTTQDG